MTFSIAQIVAVLILGVSSFLSGWMLRRIQAKGREAQLLKVLVDAQTTIPSLETNIRNRDQRIASLFAELTEWKSKVPSLEASTKRKDGDMLAKDRELNAARVEIDALKLSLAAAPAVDPVKQAELATTIESLRRAEVRCAELTAEVAARDARLADVSSAVPAFIALPVAPATQSEGELLARVDSLESAVIARDQHIAALQARVGTETDLRNEAQKTCNVQAGEIERVTSEAAKWQARVPKLVATIKARDATIASALAENNATKTEKDAIVAAHDALVAQRDTMLAEHDATLRRHATEAERLNAELDRSRADLARVATDVHDRDARLAEYDSKIAERDALIEDRDALLAEHDAVSARQADELAKYRAEVEQLRATSESLESALEQSEARAADASMQLATAQEQHAALAHTIGERDRAAATLEQRVVAMSQDLNAAAAENATKLATALRLGREEIDSHRATLERIKAERDAKAARVGELERAHDAQLIRAADMERDLELLTGRISEAEGAAAEAKSAAEKAERATADAQRAAAEAEGVVAGAQHAAAEAERTAAEKALRDVEIETQRRTQQAVLARQLTALEEQLAAMGVRSETLERQRAVLEEQLAHARQEHATAHVSLAAQLEAAHERTATLERHLDAEQRQRADAATKLESMRQMLSEAQMNLVESDTHRTTLEQQIAQLQSEHIAHDRQELDAERAEKARMAADLEDQTAELDALRNETHDLHARVAPLETLLKQRDAALFERTEQVEALTAKLEAMAALQTMLRQRDEQIAALERQISEQSVQPAAADEDADRRADHIEERLVAQIEKNRELTKLAEERERDLAAATKANELNGKSMLILKQQLDDARATEDRLAVQLRELKSSAQRAPEVDTSGVKVVMSKPAGLFELPPERIDELQQIRGIGDGFERGLNKLGIYQFSQLAGLSVQEIAWVEAHLPTFHGRVDRDDWPGQAAALIAASEHAEWSLRAQNGQSVSPRPN